MNTKHPVVVFLLALWATCSVNAQEAKKELENISKVYKEQKNYKCKAAVKVFETYTSVAPLENFESMVYHAGNKHLYNMGGTIQFSDGSTHVVVDSSNQAIVVSEKPKGFDVPHQMELDTIIKYFTAEIVNKPTATSLGKMIMKPSAAFKKYSEMEKLEIFYDKKYVISKWIMYSSLALDMKNDGNSSSKPRLEMTFGKMSPINESEIQQLDKKYYFYAKGNTLYPSEKFKGFNIIDGRVKVTK